MKYTLNISTNDDENAEEIILLLQAPELYSCIYDVDQKLRARIKWENISDAECNFLEDLRCFISQTMCKVDIS